MGFWDGMDHMQTICTSLHTDNHINTSWLKFYRPMLFLTSNQQCQSTEGTARCRVTLLISRTTLPLCHAANILLSYIMCLTAELKARVKSTETPSVLWRCWLGGRKGILPVKNWVVGCWRGYLSGERCRLAYGPADATATHCLLLQ